MAEISGTIGRDALTGTAGADILSGGDAGDRILAGAGDDVVLGHSLADLQAGSERIDAALVASGLAAPLFAVSPPGDPDRLFIVEQRTGRIRILDLNTGQLNGDHFLDLPDSGLATGSEQGLLGLAFHPDYAANGRFFVNLTNAAGDTEVREYRAADANHADTASAQLVLALDQPFANHNGGWMAFGPDGMLYISSGDGGSSGDPNNNAQNPDSLFGKILRIDVNGGDAFPADPGRNYAIPAGNPFAGPAAGADEVWLYGLRNPWRASFDAATGDLWIGDVGERAREEIDVALAGQSGLNFGWRFQEGFQPFSGTAPGGLTNPIVDYDRSTPLYSGFSVTGGYVYHGPGGMQGLYIFGDFGSANLWSLRLENGQAQEFLNRNEQLALTAGDFDQLASFAVDGRGRLYAIGLDGEIHRLTPGATVADGGDFLRGEDGNDQLWGGLGPDDLQGNTGNDTVSGGLGGDWVVGGKDDDSLFGNAGDDIVLGNLGQDSCAGGAGNDVVRGGQGQDVVRGGLGDDFISGDRGDDVLTGGAGADLFNSFAQAGLDRIEDFNRAEGDRLVLEDRAAFVLTQEGADAVVTVGGAARVVLVGVQAASLTGDWIIAG
ncbi:PQQ-dependent sugar dehydrogenase [Phenylobacterium sp. LjRoot219]|uniref:PQQ-dependent sugar dehydrogenase n=1 Tax=Phenylobacterium sp. LjRoot219 TaxID=3342283 RepID=UPI003ED0DA9A